MSSSSKSWGNAVVFCAAATTFRLLLNHRQRRQLRERRAIERQEWSSDTSSNSDSSSDDGVEVLFRSNTNSQDDDDAVEELPGSNERTQGEAGGSLTSPTSSMIDNASKSENYDFIDSRKHDQDENQLEAAGPFCYFKMSKYRYSFDQSADISAHLAAEDSDQQPILSVGSNSPRNSPHRRISKLSAGSRSSRTLVPAVPEEGPIGTSKENSEQKNRNSSSSSSSVLNGGIQRSLVRSNYNARILPSKVILIRHGQSLGNITENAYCNTADNSIPLTDFGWEQARMAGKAMKHSIIAKGESVRFVVSPYVRTMETFHGLVSAWCDPKKELGEIADPQRRKEAWYHRLREMGVTFNEDPRIREQDFGNYQDADQMKISKEERHQFGLFYYRFANGESASDVYDRVSTFLDSLWRSFDIGRHQNYVLVTHGISIRVFLARYFRYSVDEFTSIANPRNCEMVILEHDGKGRLRLQGRCELTTSTTTVTGDGAEDKGGCFLKNNQHNGRKPMKQQRVTGYKMHHKLREVPEARSRFRNIRLSVDDTPSPYK